ncbi:7TM chemoreceptor [Teladorsagia circumcincta]|uniref:7TM chemoreceptor n=1 Tax=Teladorsagia circumcincta TaxID=45464 RepID=A0A2G9UUN7_TELCI|nr:7TM chemoreceptor [Teladorsagia circumcincta]
MNVQEFVAFASTFILILGTTLNIIFIYAIRNGTRSAVGQVYKNIMTCFAVCNIGFAGAEFIAKPGIHIYGTSLMTFSHGILQRMKPWGLLSLCVFIGMYGVTTALLSLHFVYRYVAVCRQHLLRMFQKTTCVVAIILIILSWGIIYGFISFYCFAATDEYYKYANPSVYAKFGEDAHNLSFFCIFTYEVKGNATTIYWSSAIGLGTIYVMMLFTFVLMIFCGVQMYRTLRKSSMSQKSKKLQTQLLKALVVQAVIPFFTSYLSRTVMYTSVVIGLEPLPIYAFTPLVVTIYTVADPIAIMFFVCDFRQTVTNLKRNVQSIFCCLVRSEDQSKSQRSVVISEANGTRSGKTLATVY